MNYNRRFKYTCRDFFYPRQSSFSLCSTNFDNDGVFAYYKCSSPYVLDYGDAKNSVRPLYMAIPNTEPLVITKAEKALDCFDPVFVRTLILNDKRYYITKGMLFDEDKHPIVMSLLDNDSRHTGNLNMVAAFDYSILRDQDGIFNKFILRKLIPYLYSNEKLVDFPVNVAFMNLNQFILKPNPTKMTSGKLKEILPETFMKQYGR